MKSKFTGRALGSFGIAIASIFLTVISLGLLIPWVVVMKQEWMTKHTVIDGNRLVFKGTAIGLFATWVKILLLIFITLGLYSFAAKMTIHRWVVKNTHLAKN